MLDWLHRRKISDSVITEFNVHWGEHPIMGECIIIPVFTETGEFSFNKYRRSPLSEDTPKYVYDKGGHTTLYGWHKAKSEQTILITEGEIDSLVAWSHNIPAVSSTGGALSFPPDWGKLLDDKDVILCFDADGAGGEGMAKALDIIPWAKLVFIPTNLPHVKDVSDFVKAGGDLQGLLSTARRYNGLEEIISDKSERQATWQNTFFHDAYIKKHTTPTYVKTSSPKRELGNAKDYPIPDMVKLDRSGRTKCLWHAETEASLQYYPKDNRMWCFGGCGRGYDAIDVYMKVNNVKFIEAINQMKNL